MRLVVALLLLATALAGCTGGGPEFVTARSLLPEAQKRAETEVPGAQLVALFSLAATDTSVADFFAGSDAEHWIMNFFREPDPDLTDGRFQAWGFLFRGADGNQTVGLVLGPGGKVFRALDATVATQAAAFARFTPEGTDGVEDLAGGDLGEWSVDSDAAASKMRETDANFTRGGAAPGVLGWAILSSGEAAEASPVWTVGVEGLESEPGNESVGIVDARTGAVLDFGPLLSDIGVPAEGGLLSGAPSLAEPDEQILSLGLSGHEWLGLQFVYGGRPPFWPVIVTLTREEGAPQSWSPDRSAGYGDLFIPLPETGTWTLRTAIDTSNPPVPPPAQTRQGFLLSWCATDGPQAPVPSVEECKPLLDLGGASGAPRA